jgi:hypothetical protein
MLYDWSRADQHDAAEVRAPSGVFFDETLRDGVQAPQIGNPTIDERLRTGGRPRRLGGGPTHRRTGVPVGAGLRRPDAPG